MRKRILYFITIITLFLSVNAFVPNALSQTNPPLTLEQILIAMVKLKESSGATKKQVYSKILNDIRQRKVDFTLTKEYENLLRNEGATGEFIDAIRKNSSPISNKEKNENSVTSNATSASSDLTDINGEYNINYPIPGTLILTKQGEALTGSLQMQLGTMPIKETIKNGKITSEGFSFSVTVENQSQKLEVFVKGLVKRNSISGTIESSQGRIPFSGTKNMLNTQPQTTTSIQVEPPKPVYLTYLEVGNKYFDEFDFDRAIEEYNKVLKLDPQNTSALIQRIYVRHYKEDSDFGFADYNSAIKINPNLASEPSMICVLYDAPNNNADDIIENCNKAISAKPNFSLFYYKRANAYRHKQNYEQAITDYGKATELYQDFYSAYINRGQTFTDKEDYEKARTDFRKAIEIDPKNAAAYYYRGLIYQKKLRPGSFDFFYLVSNEADYNQFRNDFNKAIELNPRLAVAYYNRGLLVPSFIRNPPSVLDQSLLDFNKVIEIDPNFANAYFGRGLIYHLKGERDQAITEFTKAIELDPNLAAAYSERGYVYLLKKDCDRAILEFTKGIELDPSLSFAYDNRAECYMNKKDFDRALKDFDKLIELEPDRYPAYEKRASVYEKLGQKNLADQDRKKASEVKKAVLTNAQLNRNSTNPSIVSGGFVGQISDKNKKPIPGVTVTITNKNTGFSVLTKTDEKGTFSRNGLPPGRYEIKFSASGYKTLTLDRDLFATRTNEIIPPPVLELESNP